MFKLFIERPVLSTVISIFIVVLGVIGLYSLPVEQYPNIAPPTVKVSTTYTGANAEAVRNSVIVPLEEQINGVEGMTYITSSANNGGMAEINVFFKQGTDPDIATVNVQNRVSKASSILPAEVTKNGVSVEKVQSGNILMIQLTSTNKEYDKNFLTNYVKINIVPQLKRIYGVGGVTVYGGSYSMRIWLKPDVMKNYGLSSEEVISAINDQNIEAAPGELGVDGDQSFQYVFKYTGKLKTTEEFENIIIKSSNASVLRVKDVARVELGADDYTISAKYNGSPVATMMISQIAGSNASEIITNVKSQMKVLSKSFPKGLEYNYQIDASKFLDASINKVKSTLFEVFVLVLLIIMVFLQNFRASIIPAIAVPVSIIGTFFFLSLFGFTINLLTLFALVLAIGMVVDDAIVVVEAVFAQFEAGITDSKQAVINTLKEISPAIISMTLVSAAVFIPVSFIGGTSGVFFNQFGLTLAVAIVISGINALTLSPVLSSILIKNHVLPRHRKRTPLNVFYMYFNRMFDGFTNFYAKVLKKLAKRSMRWLTALIVIVFILIIVAVSKILPTGFVPSEDSGNIIGTIELVPGSSKEQTIDMLDRVYEIIKEIPEIEATTSISGINVVSGRGSSKGTLFFKLTNWKDRERTAKEIVSELQQKSQAIKGATFLYFGIPTLSGFGMSAGVDLKLQDKTGGDTDKFYKVAQEYLNKLRDSEEVMIAMNSFNPNYPQKLIEPNIAKIKDSGITLGAVMGALQNNIGSLYISNFNSFGKQYRVIVQSDPQYRRKLEDLSSIFIKLPSGEMAPVSSYIDIKDVTSAQVLTRFNLFNSMDFTVIPNYYKGKTTSDVINLIENKLELPFGYGYEFAGMSREEAGNKDTTAIILVLSLIFVYLLLSAMYESYFLPLAVILSLPLGIAGIYLATFYSMISGTGIVNNIYVQISMVMIIGLLSKTAILIVEYALQRRKQGMSIVKAAVTGAVARLRPVMMTALTMIIGLIPLAIATGAGALGNKSIGISAIGGMVFGTFIGIFIVPILFILFQSLHEKVSSKKIITTDDTDF
ncbi:MAG: efflux RND transporter permease subunit [Marinifilaceae bacterium]|jgi:HAE1 family hydrophobic/amphiphilic exporter-1|nr:efflux RND transporter permease subunit [Marinifilaceae bacterium]